VRHKIRYPRSRELTELCRLCMQVDSTFNLIAQQVIELEPYAVVIRYPGLHATKEEAKKAVMTMKQIRTFIRARLGLK